MTHLHINQDAIKEILIWRLRYTSLQWPTALYKSSATLSSLNNSHQSNNTHTIMHTSIFPQSALLKFPTLVSSSHFPGKSAAEGQQCVVKLTYHMAVQQCLFTDAQTAKPLSKHSLRHIHATHSLSCTTKDCERDSDDSSKTSSVPQTTNRYTLIVKLREQRVSSWH